MFTYILRLHHHHYTPLLPRVLFFFFNDTATTEIYPLSLHDALPISSGAPRTRASSLSSISAPTAPRSTAGRCRDRKSTRLNSSHSQISYAVFCLKKKRNNTRTCRRRSN